MAQVNYYLDNRKTPKGKESPIMMVVRHGETTAMIRTGISATRAEFVDGAFIGRNASTRQKYLDIRKASLETLIYQLLVSGELEKLSAKDIKERFREQVDHVVPKKRRDDLFESRYIGFMNTRKSPSTQNIYLQTLNKLRRFCRNLPDISFEEMNKEWIHTFIRWEYDQGYKDSSIAIDLRNLRAVFNDAIDDEITRSYPFRKITIRQAHTKDRSMSKDELLQLFSTPVAPWQEEYLDIFKLIFMLCGINIGDLCLLTGIRAGRIEYNRQKTGKHYSIKVEPEAMEIIEKYRGEKYLLNILDRYKSYQDYLAHMNSALKAVGKTWENGKKYTGESLFPEISTYYARYSWATIAAELDIPKETIAAGLGHSQNDVTAIYIRTDMRKKVDAANRKVIDFVFGESE